MNSKKTFFSIMKEDIRHRLSLLAVSCLTFFFVYPVAALLLIGNAQQYTYDPDPAKLLHAVNMAILNNVKLYYGEFKYDMHVLIFLAIFASLMGFAYLMNSNASDYFHSLPCKRSLLFWVNTIDGALMVILPCFLFELTGALILSVKVSLSFPLTYMMGRFLANVCSFLLIYSVAILAIMLTGRFFTAICGIVFLTSFFSASGSLFYLLSSAYFKTFYETDMFGKWFNYLSPYAVAFMDKNLPGCILCIAASVIILFFDLYLYKIRPLEAANKSFVFEKTVFPIKALVVIPAGLMGALFMQGIIGSKSWAVFGIICGLIITHAVMEITHYSDFKKLFANPLQLLICSVAAFVIFAVYAFDLTGYDKYIPQKDRLASAGVISYDLEENIWQLATTFEYETDPYGEKSVKQLYELDEEKYLNDMKITDTDAILSLAENGVISTKEYANMQDDILDSEEEEDLAEEYMDVIIAYHLNNGKTVYRKYNVDAEAVSDELARIYEDPSYKTAMYSILSLDDKEVEKICVETTLGRAYPNMSAEQAAQLTAAYKKDLSALTLDTRKKENPMLCLQFRTRELLEMDELIQSLDGYYKDFLWEGNFYPVYPSFKETLAVLAETGIKPDELLDAEDITSVEVNYNMEDDSKHLSVTDKEQIKMLLDCGVKTNLPYRNSIHPIESDMDMTFNLSSQKNTELYEDPMFDHNSSRTVYSEFNSDNIPEFINDWKEEANPSSNEM